MVIGCAEEVKIEDPLKAAEVYLTENYGNIPKEKIGEGQVSRVKAQILTIKQEDSSFKYLAVKISLIPLQFQDLKGMDREICDERASHRKLVDKYHDTFIDDCMKEFEKTADSFYNPLMLCQIKTDKDDRGRGCVYKEDVLNEGDNFEFEDIEVTSVDFPINIGGLGCHETRVIVYINNKGKPLTSYDEVLCAD